MQKHGDTRNAQSCSDGAQLDILGSLASLIADSLAQFLVKQHPQPISLVHSAEFTSVFSASPTLVCWILQRHQIEEYNPTAIASATENRDPSVCVERDISNNNAKYPIDQCLTPMTGKKCSEHFELLKGLLKLLVERNRVPNEETKEIRRKNKKSCDNSDDIDLQQEYSVDNLSEAIAHLVCSAWIVLIKTSTQKCDQPQLMLSKEIVEWFFIYSAADKNPINYLKIQSMDKTPKSKATANAVMHHEASRRLGAAAFDRCLIASCWHDLGRCVTVIWSCCTNTK